MFGNQMMQQPGMMAGGGPGMQMPPGGMGIPNTGMGMQMNP